MGTPTEPTPDLTIDNPPCARRGIPLSLRMFAVTLTILSVGSVLWIGIPAYRQQVLVREIEQRGFISLKPVGPRWLRHLVGDARMRMFDEIVEVDLCTPETTDTTLPKIISGLSSLRRINLENTQVTDAGLAHLRRLTHLSSLRLGKTQVTDAGLIHLKGLTELKELVLSNTQITDAGLIHLKGLMNLEVLLLDCTHVTDTGLRHLTALPNLGIVWLSNTLVTDAGVAKLKQAMPELRVDTTARSYGD